MGTILHVLFIFMFGASGLMCASMKVYGGTEWFIFDNDLVHY